MNIDDFLTRWNNDAIMDYNGIISVFHDYNYIEQKFLYRLLYNSTKWRSDAKDEQITNEQGRI